LFVTLLQYKTFKDELSKSEEFTNVVLSGSDRRKIHSFAVHRISEARKKPDKDFDLKIFWSKLSEDFSKFEEETIQRRNQTSKSRVFQSKFNAQHVDSDDLKIFFPDQYTENNKGSSRRNDSTNVDIDIPMVPEKVVHLTRQFSFSELIQIESETMDLLNPSDKLFGLQGPANPSFQFLDCGISDNSLSQSLCLQDDPFNTFGDRKPCKYFPVPEEETLYGGFIGLKFHNYALESADPSRHLYIA